MRTLYLDCGMGAAGDMLTAALLDLLPESESFVSEFNALGIPNVKMELERGETHGIQGLHVHILIRGREEGEECSNEPHERRCLLDIKQIISSLPLSANVCKTALEIYSSIANAEAKVHGRPVNELHFHELGALDAVADIVAACMLIERLAPERIVASPVNVGSGQVKCAHGILPVPAPATAELLRGIPSYGSEIKAELCTPTGAALLSRFASSFGSQPEMSVSDIGYGIGSRVFPAANCVRALLGEAPDSADCVAEISCNVDDMSGEAIGFALETLLDCGALDAYTVPIGMKKSRPGVMLCCISRLNDADRLAAVILRHTTSLGVRISYARRILQERSIETVSTPLGDIRVKHAGGRSKPEYEDIARIARENGMTLAEAAELTAKG